MRVTLDNLIPDLDQEISKMERDELCFASVAHIGNKTMDLGRHFSNYFNIPLIGLPSLDRRSVISKPLIQALNRVYNFLPVPILRVLSGGYKRMYRHSERTIPEFDSANLSDSLGGGSLLLVDDNSLTGLTFEAWKGEIQRINPSPITTFSITATGDYRPDYFCYDSWRSFSWRPIGI